MKTTQVAAAKKRFVVEVMCESHLIDGFPLERIGDEPFDGCHPCDEVAVWRVTFSGAATDDGRATLRMKCHDCAQGAAEFFGDDAIVRPL